MEKNNFENQILKQEQLDIKIERIDHKDWQLYKDIRLESIYEDGEAFDMNAEKIEREISRPDSVWQEEIDKQIIILSKNNSQPVGIVKGVKRLDGTWGLHYVYLNKNFRKSITKLNTAEEMIQKVLEEISKEEKDKLNKGQKIEVRLSVNRSKSAAIKLYEKFGFVRLKDEAKAVELVGEKNKHLLKEWQIMELYLDIKK